MSNILEKARAYRRAIIAAVPSLDDRTASTSPELFPTLIYDGALIKAGKRINWRGTLKRASVDLWDTVEDDPDHAPALWEDLEYRRGYRVIPEVLSSTCAFSIGECGWWGDELYISKREANVWTPEAYPEAWEKLV